MAEPDYDAVDGVTVEDHMIGEIGWVGAAIATAMPELDDVAK